MKECCKAHTEKKSTVHSTTHKSKKQEEKKNMMGYGLLILSCVLLIFSTVQAVQIIDLKEDIGEGVFAAPTSAASTPPPVVSRPQPAAMVGGC